MARPRQVLVGGTNRQLAALLSEELEGRLAGFAVISDVALIPAELRGLHPANPVNRPPAGGAQLELPPSARGTSPGSDRNPPLVVDALVAAVRAWESTSGRDGPAATDHHRPAAACKSGAGPLASKDTPSGRYDT
jgi:hypothetical protein